MRPVALLLALVLLAGCGGTAKRAPRKVAHLPPALASSLAHQADGVAGALVRGNRCRAGRLTRSLQASVIAAVNRHRVPPRFLEPLTSKVNALAGKIACTSGARAVPVPHGTGARQEAEALAAWLRRNSG